MLPILSAEAFRIESEEELKPLPFVSKLNSRYVGDFATTAVRRDWIVKKALLARTLNLLIGAPGCGKSFLALDLAMNLGLAAVDDKHPKTWFRRRIKPCGVVYIAGEGQEDFIFRMRAWLVAKGLPLDIRMPVVLVPTAVDLRSDAARTADLIEEIKARSAECLAEFGVTVELLVIDTVSKALAGGDDVKPEHIGAFFRNCGAIRDECGTTTIAVHHTPKGGKLEARGHGSVTADNDGEWTVEAAEGPTPNNWRINRIKAAATGDKHEFRLRVQKLGVDEDGDDITSLVVSEGGFEQSEEAAIQQDTTLAQREGQTNMTPDGRVILGDNLTAGVRALQKAIEAKRGKVRDLEDKARLAAQEGKEDEAKRLLSEAAAKTQALFAPQDVRAPHGRIVATLAEWKEEIGRAMPAEDKQSDAFRKRVERFLHQAGQSLIRRGIIEIDGEHVWRTTRRVASVDRPQPSERDAKSSARAASLSENPTLSSEDRAELSDPLAIPF